MGNENTHVSDGNKAQLDNASSPVYQLVNLNGGDLMDLMKVARRTKDYRELDAAIISKVKPHLYNGGDGKLVSVREIVLRRSGEWKKQKSTSDRKKVEDVPMTDINIDCERNGDTQKGHNQFKKVCWDLDARGAVGETCLHMCLLNQSTVSADLAKRLLNHFPALINDVYNADEYYGENVLHMAIVNEEPSMVKFLLDKGADVHQSCCGNFFCPLDQRLSRTNNPDHEWVDLCVNTNYHGYTYWGEYPLGFAACVEQEECIRLLIAKGADPNRQDANGNTVMHMLVIYSKLEMFDLLHGLGGSLDIKNRQNLTPLTLAAKLARKEMYEHILEIERDVCWIYGSVTCAAYPLKNIDTISPTGHINKDSVLSLIVYGEDKGHLDMMDGLVVNLLQEKWKTFAKFRFYRRFLIFSAYFLIFVISFALRPGTDLFPTIRNITVNGTVTNQTQSVIDSCYLRKYYRTDDVARWIMECIVCLGASGYLFVAINEMYHVGAMLFFTTLQGAPAKALFLFSCVFVILMVPGRVACLSSYEDIMGVLAVLSTAPYFLFFCRGFKIVGPFVVMIYKMIKGDLLRFFMIYAVFVIGFSQAMYIVFRGLEGNVFNDPLESMMGMFVMSLGQFGDFYESFKDTNQQYMGIVAMYLVFLGVESSAFNHPLESAFALLTMCAGEFEDLYGSFSTARYVPLAVAIFVIYMILVTLLLVNMLIAMMGNTYQLINETQKEYFRQWSNIVLVVEQSVPTQERMRLQKLYSQPISGKTADRALVIRWHQSVKEKETLHAQKQVEKHKQKLALLARTTELQNSLPATQPSPTPDGAKATVTDARSPSKGGQAATQLNSPHMEK